MHSPTSLLSKLLIVELLLLLHLCSILRLLHGLLIAHHNGDLADLFCFHSQPLNKLFTRLLVATETAKPHAIMKRLSTTHTERHCFTNSTKNAVLFHPCSMNLNTVFGSTENFADVSSSVLKCSLREFSIGSNNHIVDADVSLLEDD